VKQWQVDLPQGYAGLEARNPEPNHIQELIANQRRALLLLLKSSVEGVEVCDEMFLHSGMSRREYDTEIGGVSQEMHRFTAFVYHICASTASNPCKTGKSIRSIS
jgi:hypothetical protein